jgi:hypothetical protein
MVEWGWLVVIFAVARERISWELDVVSHGIYNHALPGLLFNLVSMHDLLVVSCSLIEPFATAIFCLENGLAETSYGTSLSWWLCQTFRYASWPFCLIMQHPCIWVWRLVAPSFIVLTATQVMDTPADGQTSSCRDMDGKSRGWSLATMTWKRRWQGRTAIVQPKNTVSVVCLSVSTTLVSLGQPKGAAATSASKLALRLIC